jgi:hypothetical protein
LYRYIKAGIDLEALSTHEALRVSLLGSVTPHSIDRRTGEEERVKMLGSEIEIDWPRFLALAELLLSSGGGLYKLRIQL